MSNTRAKRLYLIDDSKENAAENMRKLAEISAKVNSYIQEKQLILEKTGFSPKYGKFDGENCSLDTVMKLLRNAYDDLWRSQGLINHYKYCDDKEIEEVFSMLEIVGLASESDLENYLDIPMLENADVFCADNAD